MRKILIALAVVLGGCAVNPPPMLEGETPEQYRARLAYTNARYEAWGRSLQNAGRDIGQIQRNVEARHADDIGPKRTTCNQYGRQVQCTHW